MQSLVIESPRLLPPAFAGVAMTEIRFSLNGYKSGKYDYEIWGLVSYAREFDAGLF
jgi:hypothetical protein